MPAWNPQSAHAGYNEQSAAVVGQPEGLDVGFAVGVRLGLCVGFAVGVRLGLNEFGDDRTMGCDVSTAALAIAGFDELWSIAVTLLGSLAGAAIAVFSTSAIVSTTSVGSTSLGSPAAAMTAALGTSIVNATSPVEEEASRRSRCRRRIAQEPAHTPVTVTWRASTPAIVAAIVVSSSALTGALSSAPALVPSR